MRMGIYKARADKRQFGIRGSATKHFNRMDSPLPDCNGGWEQSAGLAVNQIALDGKMIHGWEFTKDLVVWMHGFTAGVEN